MSGRILASLLFVLCMSCPSLTAGEATHTFTVGDTDFLLDGKRLQIRCGELHFARVPREYWQHRLKLCKAMGLNAVCAYLFWNYHERTPGTFDWTGMADAAEFCRLAQQEGLWVVLRPGPYSCAEWEMGGLPWWLLKKEDIKLRTRDAYYLERSQRWLKEVGRVLGPQQVTRGGAILMVQVENEYGFYGKDVEYMGALRQALVDSGFDVPLFACNPPGNMRNGLRSDLFQVVNFGSNPEKGFKALRDLQPKGPLMCGEFYPGWFDTWGAPHHKGNTAGYLKDLDYMLKQNGSFSIYMAHGGSSFGLWAGADQPFKPDTSSYDYDAPVSEAGWIGDKFQKTRELFAKHLLPGETIPEPPARNPVIAIPAFTLGEVATIQDNLPTPVEAESPGTFEAMDLGQGAMLYRTTLPAGPAGSLEVAAAHDFAWIRVDGAPAGIFDRRSKRYRTAIPARTAPAQLDILIHTMGRVNFGAAVHDRKGLHGPVRLVVGGQGQELKGWRMFKLPLDAAMIGGLRFKTGVAEGPAFWRGTFTIAQAADTFLDLRNWGKGVVWVNGHCLGRFWNIGPTQTMYVPGPWLKAGANQVVVLDLLGPARPELAALEQPILDQLRPELDFARGARRSATLKIEGVAPIHAGSFPKGTDIQEVRLAVPITARQVCFESLGAHDGKDFAAIAEFDLLTTDGRNISHADWTIAYVDSEEQAKEDGAAGNAIDGQTANFWHTRWSSDVTGHPHRLVIDLGADTTFAGFRYVPRGGDANVGGRIKDYRIYAGPALAVPK